MNTWNVFRAGSKICIQNSDGGSVKSYPIEGTAFSITAASFGVSCGSFSFTIPYNEIEETDDGMGGRIPPSKFAAYLGVASFVYESVGFECPTEADFYTLPTANQEYMLAHIGNFSTMEDVLIKKMTITGFGATSNDFFTIRVWQQRGVNYPFPVPPIPNYFQPITTKADYTSLKVARPTFNSVPSPITTVPVGNEVKLASFKLNQQGDFSGGTVLENITVPKSTTNGWILISAYKHGNSGGGVGNLQLSVNLEFASKM